MMFLYIETNIFFNASPEAMRKESTPKNFNGNFWSWRWLLISCLQPWS